MFSHLEGTLNVDADTKGTRILIAAANPALAASYRDFLSCHGFEVAIARDGLDCVAKLRRRAPDVLVIERELPWGQGDGVLALMAEEPDLPKVPVIVLSAGDDRGRRRWPGALPQVAVHRKPLPPAELEESIRRLRLTEM